MFGMFSSVYNSIKKYSAGKKNIRIKYYIVSSCKTLTRTVWLTALVINILITIISLINQLQTLDLVFRAQL